MKIVELNYGRDFGIVDDDGEVYRVPSESMTMEEFKAKWEPRMKRKPKKVSKAASTKRKINRKKGY